MTKKGTVGPVFRAGSPSPVGTEFAQVFQVEHGWRPTFTLSSLIVVSVLATLLGLAIFVPGLMRARATKCGGDPVAGLRRIVTAQENFRSNDLDHNGVSDYWMGDIAGLYCLKDLSTGNPIAALNDIGVASADTYRLDDQGLTFSNRFVAYDPALLLSPAPYAGYWFAALDASSGGKKDAFGAFAIPAVWDPTGSPTYLVNEGASVFRRDFGAGTPTVALGKATLIPDWPASGLGPWCKVE